jgi:hypothetical protein
MFALAAVLSLVAAPAPAQETVWQTGTGTTVLVFNRHVLEALGVSWSVASEAAVASGPDRVELAVLDSSAVKFIAPGGDVEGFLGGSLAHAGGVRLSFGGQELAGERLELIARKDALAFDVRDAQGMAWLTLPVALATFDPGWSCLEIRGADMLVAADLAMACGVAELEGACLGSASMRLDAHELDARVSRAAPRATAKAPPCDAAPAESGDVALGAISEVSVVGIGPGGSVELSAAVEVRNAGERPLDGEGDNAPRLSLILYDIGGEIPRLLGRSGARTLRGFANTGCPCRPGRMLHPHPCVHREPVWEIPELGSNGVQAANLSAPAPLLVRPDAFEAARGFLLQASIFSSADPNVSNDFASVVVSPLRANAAWLFPITSGKCTGTVLDVWAPRAGVTAAWVHAEGCVLQVAAKATAKGPSEHQYDYLILCPGTGDVPAKVTVPLPHGLVVLRASSSDEDEDAGNDWSMSAGVDRVTWQAPESASARETPAPARLLTFRIVAETPPCEADVEIEAADGSKTVIRLPAPSAPPLEIPKTEFPAG